MQAVFPTLPKPTLGSPNLFILNNLLQYICKCAQMHKSNISKKMNLLYVTVDPTLYTHFLSGEAYPTNQYPFPNYIDEVPNFTSCNNDNDCAAAKITHAIALKMWNNVVNMNTALINALLSLIQMAFKILYEQEWMMDPNAVFHQCFDWFVVKYGRTLSEDCKNQSYGNGHQLAPLNGIWSTHLAPLPWRYICKPLWTSNHWQQHRWHQCLH